MKTQVWALVVLIGCGVFFLVTDPIPQSQDYHNFADQRMFGAIPNFFDVTSNGPFLVAGLAGMVSLARFSSPLPSLWQPYFSATVLFTISIAFVAIGSGYYHWNPNNQTLVWDRLPMAFGFMSLLFHIICQSFSLLPSSSSSSIAGGAGGVKKTAGGEARSKALVVMLWGMVLLGAASVWVWAVTDDLRLYGLVQFGSMAAAFVLLLWKRDKIHQANMLWGTLLFYVAAKLTEAFDRQIFQVTALYCSGHTLKHLLAAVATWIAIRALIAGTKHHLTSSK